jgi:recombination associated protein RdgC
MWFKNLRVFRLTQPWTLTHEQLNEKLGAFEFNPCGSLDLFRYGFTPPLGKDSDEWVHSTNGRMMICAKRQEKILPSGVIKEQIEEKTLSIENAEQRKLSRKEKQNLKDEIIFSLLPKAFTRSRLDFAYIDPKANWIIVNSASAKRAEDLMSKLREALGSLPSIPLATKHLPTQTMTRWLREAKVGNELELGDECELIANKDGRVIRCKKQDLTASEIRNHLDLGMQVNKLTLIWKESVHLLIDDQCSIKRLRFEGDITDPANERQPETKAEQFDLDFSIMALELDALIKLLIKQFGGLDTTTVTL